jgi:hypothetical protein
MRFVPAAIAGFAALVAATLVSAATPAGAVYDPDGLLSSDAAAAILEAAGNFRKLTGRSMIVAVLPRGGVVDLDAMTDGQPKPPAGLGIVFALSREDKTGRLLIVDPAWREALPPQWTYMYPQRLAELYGDEEGFERRVVLSARYLADVLADKVAFVMKPRGGHLSEGSLRFARGSYIGLEILGYFIIIFTAFRTFWPARLRDEDQDEFSNELRRLKKERQIW